MEEQKLWKWSLVLPEKLRKEKYGFIQPLAGLQVGEASGMLNRHFSSFIGAGVLLSDET